MLKYWGFWELIFSWVWLSGNPGEKLRLIHIGCEIPYPTYCSKGIVLLAMFVMWVDSYNIAVHCQQKTWQDFETIEVLTSEVPFQTSSGWWAVHSWQTQDLNNSFCIWMINSISLQFMWSYRWIQSCSRKKVNHSHTHWPISPCTGCKMQWLHAN